MKCQKVIRLNGLGKVKSLCTDSVYRCIIMKVPVDDGPGKIKFALMDQNGPEKV